MVFDQILIQTNFVVLNWPFIFKILSKKTIVKVKGRGVIGVWSKTILSRFLILGPFPKENNYIKK